MKKKNPIILENILIEDYAAEGKSLARTDGKVIFIENTIPGDVVDVYLFKNKKDWAAGWPMHFKEYSSDRVEPFCQHFGVCGGCQWQMLPYEQQLLYKQKQVADNLKRIGKVVMPEISAIIGCEDTRYYRNKLEYTFSAKKFIPNEEFRKLRAANADIDKAGLEDVAGFHAKGVFDKVVEIDLCHLQPEPSNQLRKTITAYAKENKLSFYNIEQHEGFLRNMQLRMATTGEIMLNIVFGYENEPVRKKLLDYVLKQFPGLTTLLYTINSKMNDTLNGIEPVVYFGKGHIIEKLENFQFKISPKSFFQTNTMQAENLYRVARNFAELDGRQIIYDLYCGTGSIGIFVSNLAKKVVGVDMVEDAIRDACQNVVLNNIHHASFFLGDVIKICNDEFFAVQGVPDIIITDPPRAGMHEKLVEKIKQIAAPIIVYISCNPATQARDLSLLDEKYTVEKIQPVDMFPHTHHIENVVQLKLRK